MKLVPMGARGKSNLLSTHPPCKSSANIHFHHPACTSSRNATKLPLPLYIRIGRSKSWRQACGSPLWSRTVIRRHPRYFLVFDTIPSLSRWLKRVPVEFNSLSVLGNQRPKIRSWPAGSLDLRVTVKPMIRHGGEIVSGISFLTLMIHWL